MLLVGEKLGLVDCGQVGGSTTAEHENPVGWLGEEWASSQLRGG